MGVDYMIKCVEAIATISIVDKEVAVFVFERSCYIFFTHLMILLDRIPYLGMDLVGEPDDPRKQIQICTKSDVIWGCTGHVSCI